MFAKKLFVLLSTGAVLFVLWQAAPFVFTGTKASAQTAAANANTAAAKPAGMEVSPEVKEKAVAMLKNAAREAQQFIVPQNRIRGQILAADLLWEHDEAAARAMFENAQGELQAMFSAASVQEAEDENYTARYTLNQMRSEFLLALAPRDPRMALNALLSLQAQTPEGMEYDPLKDESLELTLAAAIAKKDPQQGYDLAVKNLKDGVNYYTTTTLTDLYKNSPEIGAKFARDILAKFKATRIAAPATAANATNANSAAPPANSQVDLSQLVSFIQTANTLNRLKAKGTDKKIPALTDAEMREASEFAAQVFVKQGNNEPYVIGGGMKIITKYSPTSAQLIKTRLNAEQRQTLENIGESSEYYGERDEKNAEELTAEAEKQPAGPERDSRYVDAINKALEENNLEKAEQIGAKIKDKKSYEYIFDQIKTTAPLIKARRGDVGEVRNLLATLTSDDEKVKTLTELIFALAANGDKEAAGRLLDETNQFLPSRLRRKPNLESTLQIAAAYAMIEPERAFGLVESSVGQMNDLIAAGLLIDEFYEYQTTENDEILFDTMQRQGALHSPGAVKLIKNLSAADFERTVNLADRFARSEIRTFTRLKIAEALLNPRAEEREKELREQFQSEEGGH